MKGTALTKHGGATLRQLAETRSTTGMNRPEEMNGMNSNEQDPTKPVGRITTNRTIGLGTTRELGETTTGLGVTTTKLGGMATELGEMTTELGETTTELGGTTTKLGKRYQYMKDYL